MSAAVLGVIPARLGSTRLPRKPLHLLADRPLIEWVWRRVSESDLFDEIVIATDSEEVAEVAAAFGARCELTDPGHPSGTDRVAEVAALPELRRYPTIVNVQGDEPFVRWEHLSTAILLVRGEGWAVGTIASRIGSVREWLDPAVVKVVRGDAGEALLFSRAPVPHPRDRELSDRDLPSDLFLRHIGVYAYSRAALERWVALPESELERTERLEQLRPLAAGLRIGVSIVAEAEGGVDTPDDARHAERKLTSSISAS